MPMIELVRDTRPSEVRRCATPVPLGPGAAVGRGVEATSGALKVRVSVVGGPDRGAAFRMAAEFMRVGTAQECELRLKDPSVARIQCVLRAQGERLQITDHHTPRGTYVNGVRVRDAEVRAGATLLAGDSTIRVDFGDDARSAISEEVRLDGLIGGSVAMRRVYAILERASPTEAVVLIEGETGAGKDVAARAVHNLSLRAQGPFVTVDCGSISPELIESELFGHVRGAFSGAVSNRAGLFETARGGTLFLDEVGELPLALQPKLLRVLENREVRRVGSNEVTSVDVRVVAATNRDLKKSVREGTFREDLYYRLAVVGVRLPPLRTRREDIPDLARHFYEGFAGKGAVLPRDVLFAAMTRTWPGNVRELRNAIERQVSLGWPASGGAGEESDIDTTTSAELRDFVPVHLPLKEAREAWTEHFESIYLGAILDAHQGNVSRAAEAAGVNRRFLQRLMVRRGWRTPVDGDGAEDARVLGVPA